MNLVSFRLRLPHNITTSELTTKTGERKNNALKFNLRYLRYGTTKQFWSLIDTSSNQKATIRTTTNSYPTKKSKHN